MKFNYIFTNFNNGHFLSYSAFSSNTLLSKEKVDKWLSEIPAINIRGANINCLLNELSKKSIEFEIFKCPCCSKEMIDITKETANRCEKMLSTQWIELEGISGNY